MKMAKTWLENFNKIFIKKIIFDYEAVGAEAETATVITARTRPKKLGSTGSNRNSSKGTEQFRNARIKLEYAK